MVVVVLAGIQWFRPLPNPRFEAAASGSLRLPGSAPSFPWPTMGSAALAIPGPGVIAAHGTDTPLPISGLVKVMTAYQVLKDHPLPIGATGPTIPVTSAVLAEYHNEVATNQAVVPIAAGESLTEEQALEGILVASGNDVAAMLADWDAGSVQAFVTKMNTTATTLGMDATHFVDPSGADLGSVSTPADLIRLAEAAMAIPVFRAIVALPQATLPLAGVVYNLDFALGRGGFVGIKTGADPVSGGSFLFEAQKTLDGTKVRILGAVLDQRTASPTAAAVYDAYALVQAALGDIAKLPVDHAIGRVVAPWGESVPLRASPTPELIGMPGGAVRVEVHVGKLSKTIPAKTAVGELTAVGPEGQVRVTLQTSRALGGPSVLWRLTRFP